MISLGKFRPTQFATLAFGLMIACNGSAFGATPVRFLDDIQPIFRAHCGRCHGEKSHKAELNLTTSAGVLQGGESGPVFDANNVSAGRLYEVVVNREMPPEDEGQPLSETQISLIRRWIEEGANLDLPQSEETMLNQHDVLPILLLRRTTCHGRQTQEGELDLRTKDSMLKGGKSGPAIVPGDPDTSLLVKKIKAEEMPPRSKLASHSVKPVQEDELRRLVQWIRQGAPAADVPADVASTEPDLLVTDEDRRFWSFQSPIRPSIPSIAGRVHNPIDAFILSRLRNAGLDASAEAPRRVLIRRAYFDLIGLPPPPEEVESFAANTDPNAYHNLIDRLLESPRYGERWGQYWLDLAGYSDSEGVQHSDPIRPHAYRYRDYVIRSFNADKAYDQFLLEQVAGDELADYEHAPVITDALYDNLVATGFLRMTSDGTFAGITGFVPNRIDVIDDQLRVLSSAVMGLSVRCARCHSHKFDPIPQRDYYRLVALLKPAMDEHDWLKPVTGGAGNSMGGYRYLPYVTTAERLEWEEHDARLTSQIEQLNSQRAARKNDAEFEKSVKEQIKRLEAERTAQPMIRALWDRGEPSPTYLLRRGDYLQPTRLVGPGVPSVLTDGRTEFAPKPPWPSAKKTGNRLAFARWLTQPDHPLTARVLVNRVWKHHFGTGIVETLDNFGRAGARPSHPELLDWLAIKFVQDGWSIKSLHRLIMTSATYRQSSTTTATQQDIDPDNRLLSRMPIRRMEAEVLRDTLLSVAGRLDLTPFGPADGVRARSDGLVVVADRETGQRRSIYVQKRRTQPLTILDNFDRPAMSPNCVDRPVSIVAPQALHLLNDKTVHELSFSLADRVLDASAGSEEAAIDRLFMIAVGRPPNTSEQIAMLRALDQLISAWRNRLTEDSESAANSKQVKRNAFGNLCHAVINSAAFLYID